MSDWISSFVPECKTYVEVFGGAYWVYINSDIHERCQKVIYNDFNPYMTNLFRCASEPELFSKLIDSENIPKQKKGQPELSQLCHDYFYQCKKELFDGANDSEIKKIRNSLRNDCNLDVKPIADKLKRLREELKIIKDEDKENTELTKQQKEERLRPIKLTIDELLKEKKSIKSTRDDLNNEIKELRENLKENNNKCRDKIGESIQSNIDYKNADDAIKYAYILTCSFSGIDPVYSEFQDYKGKYGSKFQAFYNRLTSDKFIPKLKKIGMCENMSFEEVIATYKTEDTYLYVDPPYWNTETYYSLHGFGKQQHEELRDCLKSNEFKGKFALSYYDFDELSEWYPEDKFTWKRKEFVKPAGAKGGVKQGVGEEVLIMNYPKT